MSQGQMPELYHTMSKDSSGPPQLEYFLFTVKVFSLTGLHGLGNSAKDMKEK